MWHDCGVDYLIAVCWLVLGFSFVSRARSGEWVPAFTSLRDDNAAKMTPQQRRKWMWLGVLFLVCGGALLLYTFLKNLL